MISLVWVDHQVQSLKSKPIPFLAKGEFDLSGFSLYRRDGSKINDLGMGEMEYREALKVKLFT